MLRHSPVALSTHEDVHEAQLAGILAVNALPGDPSHTVRHDLKCCAVNLLVGWAEHSPTQPSISTGVVHRAIKRYGFIGCSTHPHELEFVPEVEHMMQGDRKSTRLNSSHLG